MASSPVRPVSRRDAFPLSFAQERFWFLHKLELDSTALNVSVAFRIEGPLDTTVLADSLHALIQRHEALRTHFADSEEGPVQVVDAAVRSALTRIDLEGETPSTRDRSLQQRLREHAQRPFDLATGPLIRMGLFRLDEDDHVLQLTLHHTVSDGWSMGIMLRELSAFYEAFSANHTPSLPDLPVQYADYAVWQRAQLENEALTKQRAYWTQKLDGAPPLELPLDNPRPVVPDHSAGLESLILSRTLTGALTALSKQEGVTLFITLLAAFNGLISRYTQQTDLVVGAPISGRLQPEIENVVGCFINTLALRTDLSGSPTFRELLGRVRTVAFEGYAHHELSFEKLVEDLDPDRELNRHPLFDVMLNFRDAKWRALALPGVRVTLLEKANLTANVAMNLYANVQEDRLHLDLVYQRALFSAERMKVVVRQFRALLEQIVSAPDTPIGRYSLVTPEDDAVLPDPRERLDAPRQGLVHEQFAAWVRKAPHQPAIRQDGRVWSYGQLADRSDRIARRLRAEGVANGDVVGVHGTPSVGLIAGMIGILRSGGVLLPLDPRLPPNRKQQMLRTGQATRLLFLSDGSSAAAEIDTKVECPVLRVDPFDGHPESVPQDGQEPVSLPDLDADDPAYIFFTSGTTGSPKGILGCHKGLSHFLNWQRRTFAIGPEDRVSQLISLSFDVMLRDIFLPLTSGATLCLPGHANRLAPADTIRWLQDEEVTVLHTVPTLAQFWLSHAPEGTSLPSLRWVFSAGEALTDALVRKWRRVLPDGGGVVNLYGPTETTMVKCFYRVPPDPRPGIQPIGRALPNTQALVLTEDDRLCGIGEPGEIVIRTPFRTLGYLNGSEVDRQRFAPNPFRRDETDVVYYTGDRGRYLPDGTLEILGRLDDQVKIRGVRVEPGEVTARLMQHPHVASCFVDAQDDEEGTPYLAAYVVLSRPDRADANALRTYLRERVLEAMIPSAFVFMSSLPVTTNGKVDRSALPDPDTSSFGQEADREPPRTPIEQAVADVWADVLDVEQPGIHDNFFDLGGHSLLAIQIIARMSRAFDVDLPLHLIFQAPTVGEMAGVVTQYKAERTDTDALTQALAELERRP